MHIQKTYIERCHVLIVPRRPLDPRFRAADGGAVTETADSSALHTLKISPEYHSSWIGQDNMGPSSVVPITTTVPI